MTYIVENERNQRLADSWAKDLERKSGLIFGHMCGGEGGKFRRGGKVMCNMCIACMRAGGGMMGTYESYDWHITEEEWLIMLLSQ